MGIMGVPSSVLYSAPVAVSTSNSGFFTSKNAGLPQPVMTTSKYSSQSSVRCSLPTLPACAKTSSHVSAIGDLPSSLRVKRLRLPSWQSPNLDNFICLACPVKL